MLNRAVLFIVLSLSCLPGVGQVKLHGEVTHDGKPIDQVTIQVYEGGKLQRTIAASKRGKYDMEFPLDHRYQLVFQRPFMIPVRISVNTALHHAETHALETVYDVPLNMEMVYRYKGLDESAYEGPIGEVSPVGEGENTFAFHPDKLRLEEVKAINELSLRLEQEGAAPLDVSGTEPRDEAPGTGGALPSAKAPEGSKDHERRETNEVPVHELEQELRMERQADRYDRIEQAKEEKAAHDRDMQMKSQMVKTNRDDVQENYILESKEIRSDVLKEQQKEEEEAIDAKVEKQDRLMSEVEHAARSKATSSRAQKDAATYGISRKKASGWFYTEEILRVSECGTKNEYKHVTYDWLLFEANYYYLNDSEIPQEMYEEARNLFK